MKELDDFIKELEQSEGYKALPDKPEPWYNKHGDCIQYCWENTDYVGDWVNSWFTLFRHPDDKHIVGFQINGINHIIK